MFKVLIVDDESIERKGLRKIISDSFSDIKIEEADNGRTAILKAEEFRPDIVFMDIKMPGIDGIEAAREIKKMDRFVQIIMVTAFDAFEYARQVMKFGAKDYILKPSTKEEIIIPLKNALDEIKLERDKRTEVITLKDNYRRALSIVQSRVITSMLVDASNSQNDIELELEQTFQKDSFVIVFKFEEKNSPRDNEEIKKFISFVQTELSHYYPYNFIGEETMGRFPILIQLSDREKNQKVTNRDRALKCGKAIINKARLSFPDYELSIGIGRTYDEIEKFVQSYHEALFALTSLKHSYSCQYYNHHVKEKENDASVIYPYDLEKKILEAVTSGTVAEVSLQFKKYLDALITFCDKHNEKVEDKLAELLVLLSRQINDSGISISINQRHLGNKSLLQLQDELISIATHIHQLYYSLNKDIMLIAKDYIKEHFETALTLEEVADVVQLSPQYFSKIFKERSGYSFIDYLTELRVGRAKDLMRTQYKSVKEVCFEVGYKDPNYFSRVFKKYTGISPSDFRQSVN